MELAQEAEAIADLPSDAEGLNGAIAHYKHMLANADNPSKQQVLVHVLQRAEGKLQQISSQQRTSRPHRLARRLTAPLLADVSSEAVCFDLNLLGNVPND